MNLCALFLPASLSFVFDDLKNICIFVANDNFPCFMKEQISQRVRDVRKYLVQHGLAAYIFPSTDPHMSEYPPEHWKIREWISGFNGSAGTAVVTTWDAALWTDSRYFIAAREQLDGTPFKLMRIALEGTPTVEEWLKSVLSEGARVGIDGQTCTGEHFELLQAELAMSKISLMSTDNPADTLWVGRPELPTSPVCIQPLAFAGRTVGEKLGLIRRALERSGADGLVLTALDEVAWTLNLRGTDVHCNPVFMAYALITPHGCSLYINKVKLTAEVNAYLDEAGVAVYGYEDIASQLTAFAGKRISIDRKAVNSTLCRCVPAGCTIVDEPSPVAMLKAVKCEAEVAGYRRAMLRDGVAMVKFLKWLRPAVEAGGVTELSACRKLDMFRQEQEGYLGESFDTIAGYGVHGAIVHYEPTPDTDVPLRPEGLFLLDSGGQYEDGTTDITRTIALGPVSDEACHDYTLVLKGHILLARAKFPQGSSGTQLDVCARYAMWQEGINYLHGTGHGVGSRLCVHEGPHQLRMNYMPAPLLPYMTLTIEPGIYKEGRHGARIENTNIILPYCETEFGKFLQFDALTLCPIDTTPIVWEMLTDDEVVWLNDYHKRVYDTLSPLLDEEHRRFLKAATEAKHM